LARACSLVQFWEHGQHSVSSMGWMIQGSNPRRENFCHPQIDQPSSGTHTDSIQGVHGLFPMIKAAG